MTPRDLKEQNNFVWQRARCLPNAPAGFVSCLIWVAGRPRPCVCGHGPTHYVYTSNLKANGSLMDVSQDYLELLPEFTKSVEIEVVEIE